MTARTDVVIIGAGFAGIAMAITLQRAGRHDFVILEKDSDLGGTWRDNSYPGCVCDVPSYLYSFSFEPNPRWTRMFSPQPEIWDYLRYCADKHGLAAHLRYGAEVTGARFDETDGTWGVEVNHGEVMRARALVAGVGALHVPHMPALPGLETFEGTAFHSARWRHDVDLTGRRVAVVGTGASAVQFLPQIAPSVEHLDLYQRTAAWVIPQPDRAITAREQALFARRPLVQRALRDLIYWGLEARGAGFALTPKAMGPLERQARRHLANQVADTELRAKLTPHYQIGCKRVLLANDYYPALTRDNVEVITDGIAQVRPRSIVSVDGAERAVDTIIFGTGFQVGGNLTSMPIVGRHDVELNSLWSRNGKGAHRGITVSGFPNLFLLLGPNTGLGHTSVVFMIESQAHYIVQALELLDRRGADYIDVRPQVQQRSVDRVQRRLSGTVWQSGCTSWYLDAKGRNDAIWPDFTWKYWLQTRLLRASEYHLGTAPAAGRAETSRRPPPERVPYP
jgi:cation diffusion facilitator CzcD-associated flavoprotein CzcO